MHNSQYRVFGRDQRIDESELINNLLNNTGKQAKNVSSDQMQTYTKIIQERNFNIKSIRNSNL